MAFHEFVITIFAATLCGLTTNILIIYTVIHLVHLAWSN